MFQRRLPGVVRIGAKRDAINLIAVEVAVRGSNTEAR